MTLDEPGRGDRNGEEVVATLERWAGSGALWRVVGRAEGRVEVSLLTCNGGEEVDRLVSADPAVLAYLGDRWSSED